MANQEHKLCPTYPSEILVPASISDSVLEKVAQFRSARRIPAIVWRNTANGAVMARCSQPEVGWLGWRSSEDEELVRALAEACAYDSGEFLQIMMQKICEAYHNIGRHLSMDRAARN